MNFLHNQGDKHLVDMAENPARLFHRSTRKTRAEKISPQRVVSFALEKVSVKKAVIEDNFTTNNHLNQVLPQKITRKKWQRAGEIP
jgi:hypothetical protein